MTSLHESNNNNGLIRTGVGLYTGVINTVIGNYPDKALYLYVKHNKPNHHVSFWNKSNWLHPKLITEQSIKQRNSPLWKSKLFWTFPFSRNAKCGFK